jgi:hypothetical protein
MSDFSGLYNIREAKDSDKNLVLATFLKGLYYGESFFSRVPKDIFMAAYKRVAQALVNDPNTKILVACLPEDEDTVMGYSMMSRDEKTVYFCFTKAAWRKRGIAKSLTPKNPQYVAHLTKLGDSLMHKLPNTKFNPFF